MDQYLSADEAAKILNKPVDPLADVLHLLAMSSVFCAVSRASRPWGMTIPPMPETMMYHVATEGEWWIELDGRDPVPMQPGDLALIPHGEGHRLVSSLGNEAPALFDLPRVEMTDRYEVIEFGGGGELNRLICGTATFSHPAALDIVGMMPTLIHLSAEEEKTRNWLYSTMSLLSEEARALRPGVELILCRLSEVLVIQAVRAWIDTSPEENLGWLGALRDPQIGRSLQEVQRQPAAEWSVEKLARVAAMSRSAFASRFKELVGESPMQFVTRWRMLIAKKLIVNEDMTLAQVAEELGYESESSFSRAFKRTTGYSPGALRSN